MKSAQAEQAFPWTWIVLAVIAEGGIWLLVGIVRSVMGGPGQNAGTGMSPSLGGGGGGMFGSLLGGMFGAAAGMWLYDQFSGSHGNAWGAEPDNRTSDTGFSGQDTDYSGTGDDFGGGDYGGGDYGGDDGDYGGGGGF